ncbi:DUF6265 family protein [Hufsiella ginkgonis]|uniref:DUF6265 domain-containing protein n=1 Tax=Hufsiella ginkgonis TaxID=2695274 RepID=A0A7K1Y392_9SPHI|nr:DUF6265 family protein [Hufsiella ginkgonis]MXV17146.1 hypothetical protein [Hufsiella ginkgonis]
MKKLIAGAFILLCTLASSSHAQAPKQLAADFKKLEWITGTWNRTNAKPGRSGHERWFKVSDTEIRGFGITMRGADTVYVEKLKLVVRDGGIYYSADVPENKAPVLFKLTEIKEDSFTCENDANEFPKKIWYGRTGNTVKAVISGGGKSVDYLFEKKS